MIRAIWRMWPDRRLFIKVAVLQTVSSIAQGLVYVMLVPLLRALLKSEPDIAGARGWLLLAVVAAAVSAVTEMRARRTGFKVSGRLMLYLQHRLGKHIATLPLGWFTAGRVGRLARVVSQSTVSAAGIVSGVGPQVIATVVTPLTVAIATYFIDWRMATAFLVMVPVALLELRWAGGHIGRAQMGMHRAGAEAGARSIEYAQAQAVLRSTGRVHEGYVQLEEALDEQRAAYRRTLSSLLLPAVLYLAVIQVGFSIVLVLGAYRALGGQLALAEVVALLVLASRFMEPLASAANLFAATRDAGINLTLTEEVLSERALPEPLTGVKPASAAIEFDHVSFSYGEARVLHDVTLQIPAGSTTALVGPSGSGKTTMTRLIARFWDVEEGAVRVGGADVRDIAYADLMRNIATVFQNVYLFDDSIIENVRLAKPGATDEEVVAAAAAARLDEVVERLPNGWHSRVGEGGSMLSGGERQRVSIARALLKDARIVLLDEPTAAVDPVNEALIHEALDQLIRDSARTVVLVAHRLQTVVAADQIAVLDGGRIVEVGDHESLIGAGGRYADFWKERSRASGWRIGVK